MRFSHEALLTLLLTSTAPESSTSFLTHAPCFARRTTGVRVFANGDGSRPYLGSFGGDVDSAFSRANDNNNGGAAAPNDYSNNNHNQHYSNMNNSQQYNGNPQQGGGGYDDASSQYGGSGYGYNNGGPPPPQYNNGGNDNNHYSMDQQQQASWNRIPGDNNPATTNYNYNYGQPPPPQQQQNPNSGSYNQQQQQGGAYNSNDDSSAANNVAAYPSYSNYAAQSPPPQPPQPSSYTTQQQQQQQQVSNGYGYAASLQQQQRGGGYDPYSSGSASAGAASPQQYGGGYAGGNPPPSTSSAASSGGGRGNPPPFPTSTSTSGAGMTANASTSTSTSKLGGGSGGGRGNPPPFPTSTTSATGSTSMSSNTSSSSTSPSGGGGGRGNPPPFSTSTAGTTQAANLDRSNANTNPNANARYQFQGGSTAEDRLRMALSELEAQVNDARRALMESSNPDNPNNRSLMDGLQRRFDAAKVALQSQFGVGTGTGQQQGQGGAGHFMEEEKSIQELFENKQREWRQQHPNRVGLQDMDSSNNSGVSNRYSSHGYSSSGSPQQQQQRQSSSNYGSRRGQYSSAFGSNSNAYSSSSSYGGTPSYSNNNNNSNNQQQNNDGSYYSSRYMTSYGSNQGYQGGANYGAMSQARSNNGDLVKDNSDRNSAGWVGFLRNSPASSIASTGYVDESSPSAAASDYNRGGGVSDTFAERQTSWQTAGKRDMGGGGNAQQSSSSYNYSYSGSNEDIPQPADQYGAQGLGNHYGGARTSLVVGESSEEAKNKGSSSMFEDSKSIEELFAAKQRVWMANNPNDPAAAAGSSGMGEYGAESPIAPQQQPPTTTSGGGYGQSQSQSQPQTRHHQRELSSEYGYKYMQTPQNSMYGRSSASSSSAGSQYGGTSRELSKVFEQNNSNRGGGGARGTSSGGGGYSSSSNAGAQQLQQQQQHSSAPPSPGQRYSPGQYGGTSSSLGSSFGGTSNQGGRPSPGQMYSSSGYSSSQPPPPGQSPPYGGSGRGGGGGYSNAPPGQSSYGSGVGTTAPNENSAAAAATQQDRSLIKQRSAGFTGFSNPSSYNSYRTVGADVPESSSSQESSSASSGSSTGDKNQNSGWGSGYSPGGGGGALQQQQQQQSSTMSTYSQGFQSGGQQSRQGGVGGGDGGSSSSSYQPPSYDSTLSTESYWKGYPSPSRPAPAPSAPATTTTAGGISPSNNSAGWVGFREPPKRSLNMNPYTPRSTRTPQSNTDQQASQNVNIPVTKPNEEEEKVDIPIQNSNNGGTGAERSKADLNSNSADLSNKQRGTQDFYKSRVEQRFSSSTSLSSKDNVTPNTNEAELQAKESDDRNSEGFQGFLRRFVEMPKSYKDQQTAGETTASPYTGQIERTKKPPGMVFEEDITESGLKVSMPLESVQFSGRSDYRKVDIINTWFGETLLVDGKTQATSTDEYMYHEALVHPALLSVNNCKTVFIGGGYELATAREVLKHTSVERVVMVDLDRKLVEICNEHLPEWGCNALQDPRLELIHEKDVYTWMLNAKRPVFDAIILDMPDPLEEGSDAKVYTKEFYSHVAKRLSPGGVFVTQAGAAEPVLLMKDPEKVCLGAIIKTLSSTFDCVVPYCANIRSLGWKWGFVVAFNQTGETRAAMPAEQQALEWKRPNEGKIDSLVERKIKGGKKSLRFYDGESHYGMTYLSKPVRQVLNDDGRLMKINNSAL